MKRYDRRSDCPTNFALQSFGDSWSLLIVRDLLFKGKRTYSELLDSEERVSTNILTDRLKSLTNQGILKREQTGRSTSYFLTEKGMALLPMMVEMIVWSARYDPNTAARPSFVSRAKNEREQLLSEIREKALASQSLPKK